MVKHLATPIKRHNFDSSSLQNSNPLSVFPSTVQEKNTIHNGSCYHNSILVPEQYQHNLLSKHAHGGEDIDETLGRGGKWAQEIACPVFDWHSQDHGVQTCCSWGANGLLCPYSIRCNAHSYGSKCQHPTTIYTTRHVSRCTLGS